MVLEGEEEKKILNISLWFEILGETEMQIVLHAQIDLHSICNSQNSRLIWGWKTPLDTIQSSPTHRRVEFARHLWRSYWSNPPCSKLLCQLEQASRAVSCQVLNSILKSTRMEIPEHLWAACSSISVISEISCISVCADCLLPFHRTVRRVWLCSHYPLYCFAPIRYLCTLIRSSQHLLLQDEWSQLSQTLIMCQML